MSTRCEHGVPFSDFCSRCAHQPVEEWVGHPMTVCGFCMVPWPCAESERKSRSAAMLGPYKRGGGDCVNSPATVVDWLGADDG